MIEHLHRFGRWADSWSADAIVMTGIVLIAYGMGQFAWPLAPIVLGLGLIAAVALGKP